MGSLNANRPLQRAGRSFHIRWVSAVSVKQLGALAVSLYLCSAPSAFAEWSCYPPETCIPGGYGGGGGHESNWENEGYPPTRSYRTRIYSSCRSEEAVGVTACEVAGALQSSLDNCLTSAQAACRDANGDFLIKQDRRYSTFTMVPGGGVSGYTSQSYACDYPPYHVPNRGLSSGEPAFLPQSDSKDNSGSGDGFPPLESERLRSYGTCLFLDRESSDACETANSLQTKVDDCIRAARATCTELNGNFSNLESSKFFIGFSQGKSVREGYAYQRYACDYPKDSVPVGINAQEVSYWGIWLNPLLPGEVPAKYPTPEPLPATGGSQPGVTMPGTGGQLIQPAVPAHTIDSVDMAVDGLNAPE